MADSPIIPDAKREADLNRELNERLHIPAPANAVAGTCPRTTTQGSTSQQSRVTRPQVNRSSNGRPTDESPQAARDLVVQSHAPGTHQQEARQVPVAEQDKQGVERSPVHQSYSPQ